MTFELRPYQNEAVDAVIDHIKNAPKSMPA